MKKIKFGASVTCIGLCLYNVSAWYVWYISVAFADRQIETSSIDSAKIRKLYTFRH